MLTQLQQKQIKQLQESNKAYQLSLQQDPYTQAFFDVDFNVNEETPTKDEKVFDTEAFVKNFNILHK